MSNCRASLQILKDHSSNWCFRARNGTDYFLMDPQNVPKHNIQRWFLIFFFFLHFQLLFTATYHYSALASSIRSCQSFPFIAEVVFYSLACYRFLASSLSLPQFSAVWVAQFFLLSLIFLLLIYYSRCPAPSAACCGPIYVSNVRHLENIHNLSHSQFSFRLGPT